MATMREITDVSYEYRSLLSNLIDYGASSKPRGESVYEIEDQLFVFTDPALTLPAGINRRYSPRILAAETMQWLSGTSDLTQLKAVSHGKFLNYSDDGIRLYGAYGPRARSTLARAIRLLEQDRDTRQAVVSLWDTSEADATKDLPCTVNWGFRSRYSMRYGKRVMKMSTTMRSQDAWTGATYDWPAMTRIGSAVAWCLGYSLAEYTHFIYSWHFYVRDMQHFSELSVPGEHTKKIPPMFDRDLGDVPWTDFRTASDRWEFIRECAIGAMDGRTDLPSAFLWYSDILRGTPRNTHLCPTCHYWLPQEELVCHK